MSSNQMDLNFDQSTHQYSEDEKLHNSRRPRQFNEGTVYKHKHLNFGLRYISDAKRSATIVDNVLNIYWPECFNFLITRSPNLSADKSPTCSQLTTWALELGYLRPWEIQLVNDLSQFEFEMFGYVKEQSRRLFALKSVVICWIWEDVFENLLRDNSQIALKLAEEFRSNYMIIMTGNGKQRDYSKFQSILPGAVEQVRNVERTAVDYITECYELLPEGVRNRYFEFNKIAYGSAYKSEAEAWSQAIRNGTYVSFDDYVNIKSFASLYQVGLYTSLEDNDLPFYGADEIIPGLSSTLCTYDKDLISYWKETRYHAPFNRVKLLMDPDNDGKHQSLREATIKFIQIRDELMQSLEVTYKYLCKKQKRAMIKNFHFMSGIEVACLGMRRYGWVTATDASKNFKK